MAGVGHAQGISGPVILGRTMIELAARTESEDKRRGDAPKSGFARQD
jgi:hypothetical protein